MLEPPISGNSWGDLLFFFYQSLPDKRTHFQLEVYPWLGEVNTWRFEWLNMVLNHFKTKFFVQKSSVHSNFLPKNGPEFLRGTDLAQENGVKHLALWDAVPRWLRGKNGKRAIGIGRTDCRSTVYQCHNVISYHIDIHKLFIFIYFILPKLFIWFIFIYFFF